MKSVNIRLSLIEDVKRFVDIVSDIDGEIDISQDRYRVCAKSLLGIFSLDLSKPLCLEISDDCDIAMIVDKLAEFVLV